MPKRSSGLVSGCYFCGKEFTPEELAQKNSNPHYNHCAERTAYYAEIDREFEAWAKDPENPANKSTVAEVKPKQNAYDIKF